MEREVRFKGNAARSWFRLRHPLRILFNSLVIAFLKYMPPVELKNSLYRHLLNVRIGRDVAISPDVILDPLFPELIEIGDGCLIGWGARIFTHEFWPDRVKIRPVKFGKTVFIGGFSVVRPGVTIHDHVFIASNSFVNKTITKRGVYGGVPAKLIRKDL
ncbi:MAG: acyltransferase [Candidatus Aenigmarchaeota archaeon]|nr:acyltransferase [Candidatus Aenigmarchaeota archaeon]